MTTIQIRAYHCDAFGHVNNARWLELFDEARWDFWQTRDYQWFANRQIALIVSELSIKYLRPAKTGDTIEISCEWDHFEDDGAWLIETAKRGNKVCATARIRLAALGPDSPRALTLQGELLDKLKG